MSIPDYGAALRDRTSSLRVGVARSFFFADLDPEIELAVNEALRVLEKISAGLRDVTLPGSTQALLDLRATVRAAEAYAYHAAFVEKSPELYQPETLVRLRADAAVDTPTYVRGRREVDLIRRTAAVAFESVDVIVTPTTPVLPPLLADVAKDVDASMTPERIALYGTRPRSICTGGRQYRCRAASHGRGSQSAFRSPGRNGAETSVLRVARAYEQATEWHRRRPAA
jgi:aspartyl-tRNA(Asn)/glutamyl-tRNA(Gln) amidotransferase subunit A